MEVIIKEEIKEEEGIESEEFVLIDKNKMFDKRMNLVCEFVVNVF